MTIFNIFMFGLLKMAEYNQKQLNCGVILRAYLWPIILAAYLTNILWMGSLLGCIQDNKKTYASIISICLVPLAAEILCAFAYLRPKFYSVAFAAWRSPAILFQHASAIALGRKKLPLRHLI